MGAPQNWRYLCLVFGPDLGQMLGMNKKVFQQDKRGEKVSLALEFLFGISIYILSEEVQSLSM